MNFFSYIVEHDYGLAPNPFGPYCTLAVCKPDIRNNSNLNIDDWIIGTGSATYGRSEHVIFAMQLSEKLSFSDYWKDPRFQYKKPVANGSLVQLFGDNFYHLNKNNQWVQEKGAHSVKDASEHLRRDTKSTNVLISEHFYYLGNNALKIPAEFSAIVKRGPGMKYKDLDSIGINFITWLDSRSRLGISGDPNNWELTSNKSQLKFDL